MDINQLEVFLAVATGAQLHLGVIGVDDHQVLHAHLFLELRHRELETLRKHSLPGSVRTFPSTWNCRARMRTKEPRCTNPTGHSG